MDVGHVLIGNDGEFLSVDTGFCAIMRVSNDAILGRLVSDITAPADLVECENAIRHLRETGRPFVIIKRFVRDDGSLVWVKNTVSITTSVDKSGDTIVATVQVVPPPAERNPAALLDVARHHLSARYDRSAVCDPKYFDEPGWDVILALYVAEAEGRSIDIERLAAFLGRSVALTKRWVGVMLAAGVVEIEYRDPDAESPKSYRLTMATHQKLEVFLNRPWPCSAEP
jgi:PAS domain S-box-containing protein